MKSHRGPVSGTKEHSIKSKRSLRSLGDPNNKTKDFEKILKELNIDDPNPIIPGKMIKVV